MRRPKITPPQDIILALYLVYLTLTGDDSYLHSGADYGRLSRTLSHPQYYQQEMS